MSGIASADIQSVLLYIQDADAPVFRIFPLWFFEEALRLKQFALLPPAHWEDPFELLPERVMMTDQSAVPHTQKPLEPFLQSVYAQCWSRTEESDTLLRAYSRVDKDPYFRRNTAVRHEGVKVRSTPRKLFEAFHSWAGKPRGISFFIGAVQYKGGQEGIRFTPKIHHNRLKYKKIVFFVCDILCDKMCDKND